MIELTLEQRKAVATEGSSFTRVFDPDKNVTYLLIREEMYARMKGLLLTDEDTGSVDEFYPQAMEVFGRDGWDDPAMDVYNELDPRRQP